MRYGPGQSARQDRAAVANCGGKVVRAARATFHAPSELGSFRRKGTSNAMHRVWKGLPPAKQSRWGPEPIPPMGRLPKGFGP